MLKFVKECSEIVSNEKKISNYFDNWLLFAIYVFQQYLINVLKMHVFLISNIWIIKCLIITMVA